MARAWGRSLVSASNVSTMPPIRPNRGMDAPRSRSGYPRAVVPLVVAAHHLADRSSDARPLVDGFHAQHDVPAHCRRRGRVQGPRLGQQAGFQPGDADVHQQAAGGYVHQQLLRQPEVAAERSRERTAVDRMAVGVAVVLLQCVDPEQRIGIAQHAEHDRRDRILDQLARQLMAGADVVDDPLCQDAARPMGLERVRQFLVEVPRVGVPRPPQLVVVHARCGGAALERPERRIARLESALDIDPHRPAVLAEQRDVIVGLHQEALHQERRFGPRAVQPAHVHAGRHLVDPDFAFLKSHAVFPVARRPGKRGIHGERPFGQLCRACLAKSCATWTSPPAAFNHRLPKPAPRPFWNVERRAIRTVSANGGAP